MEYAAFVFAIFGLLAYLQSASLKNRVDALERTLGKMKGTEQHTRLASLSDAAQFHTPDERLHIPTVQMVWDHLVDVLKNIPTI